MTVQTIDTLIVGGGQAGLAMSEHLRTAQVEHLILERNQIAESWRNGRWDSLVANGPAWHDRFPTMEFAEVGPDQFAPKEAVARYFEAYAAAINAPIRCGVEVTSAERMVGRAGFRVHTTAAVTEAVIESVFEATNIVVATGPFQQPVFPALIPGDAGIMQIHSRDYKNPAQLPDGAVMVIGAGSSGAQIAHELTRAGKRVYLSVGAHDRPPRRYRGRDYVWWLGVLGKWDAVAPTPGTEHVTISVSGAHGGFTVDFRQFAALGMTLVGMTQSYSDGALHFSADLPANIARGDANYLSVLDEADAYVARNGLNLPEEPQARQIGPDPECVTNPVAMLNLRSAGVSSVIWATGYTADYSWLKANAFDANGKPCHQRGVSSEPGVYFLGLPWLSRRGSSFIYGVWHDARYLADHIVKQRNYMNYHEATAAIVRS
ncbi:MAG: NAD(P)/FAD-dependent oxidoreductase [Burkholderiaceae bacterium]